MSGDDSANETHSPGTIQVLGAHREITSEEGERFADTGGEIGRFDGGWPCAICSKNFATRGRWCARIGNDGQGGWVCVECLGEAGGEGE